MSSLSVRSKFMACFERRVGRNSTVSREQILSFIEEYNKDPYTGIVLKFPSWLTSNKGYRRERGKYALPWTDLDAFYKENPDFKENLDKADAAKNGSTNLSEIA